VVGHAKRHRWRTAQRFVNTTQIVEGNPKRNGCAMIFQLLAVGVGEARTPAHLHSRREIESLDIRRADLVGIGASSYHGRFDTRDVTRAVAMRSIGQIGIAHIFFGQDGIVNVGLKSERDRVRVWRVTVTGDLSP
jgi:hypothetical protein